MIWVSSFCTLRVVLHLSHHGENWSMAGHARSAQISNPSSRTVMRHAGENSKPQVANQNFAVWINMNPNHAYDITRFSWWFLTCYNMFYTFTKHESSDDIQCLSSGRTRWPQLSKQTYCRNHRRFISNGASRLGRANIATRSFSTATSHSFPKPFHSIEDHQSVGFWSATSGSSDSLQHKVQIIIPKRTSKNLFLNVH